MIPTLNVLGQPIQPCSFDPKTGFYRDGCCRSGPDDAGNHSVCVIVSAEFLAFSAKRGNDLSTPAPQYQFPGLKPGDSWCLCASRWLEAHQAGVAPPVKLESTSDRALQVVSLDLLLAHAAGPVH